MPRNALHVEHANCRQRTRVPLLHVALHRGFHRVSELADDRNRPPVSRQMTLLIAVDRLLENKEGEDDCGEGAGESVLKTGKNNISKLSNHMKNSTNPGESLVPIRLLGGVRAGILCSRRGRDDC